MADIYVKSGGGTIGSGSYRGNWTASSTYALGDRVCGVATSDYWIFECTTAGTSAGTEPTWVKTADSTTTDNAVTWTARIPSTWANATFTLAKAAANDAIGDIIYVSQAHAESSATAQAIGLTGTAAIPAKVICVNDANFPPTTVATTATVSTTGTTPITLQNYAFVQGITFNAGTGVNTVPLVLAYGVLEDCNLVLPTTSSGSRIIVGNQALASQTWKDVNVKFSSSGQGITTDGGNLMWIGGSLLAGGVSPSILLYGTSANLRPRGAEIHNVDLSNALATIALCSVGTGTNPAWNVKFVNCKLPSGWTGTLTSGTILYGERVAMYNCDSGATNYRLWIETYAGSIKSETTLVKSGGATDGTTPISWKLATTANANEYVAPLITDDMAVWIDSGLGSPKTITIDILHDSATALTDSEVWIEIDYLGASNSPLGTPASDKRATVLTTAVAQTTSTAVWFTTGLTTPNKQKLEVTFTPNMRGFVYARVCLAKPSYTVYVDPQPVIS